MTVHQTLPALGISVVVVPGFGSGNTVNKFLDSSKGDEINIRSSNHSSGELQVRVKVIDLKENEGVSLQISKPDSIEVFKSGSGEPLTDLNNVSLGKNEQLEFKYNTGKTRLTYYRLKNWGNGKTFDRRKIFVSTTNFAGNAVVN